MNNRFRSLHVTDHPYLVLWSGCGYRNQRMRLINLTTEEVSTICGNGIERSVDGIGTKASMVYPRRICFDVSPGVEPERFLWITTREKIRRFDAQTGTYGHFSIAPSVGRFLTLFLFWCCAYGMGAGALTSLKTSWTLNPSGLRPLPTGHLLVSCLTTHCLVAIDSRTGEGEVLAGQRHLVGCRDGEAILHSAFNEPGPIVLDHTLRVCYITDRANHRIRRVTLPPHLFPVPEHRPPWMTATKQ